MATPAVVLAFYLLLLYASYSLVIAPFLLKETIRRLSGFVLVLESEVRFILSDYALGRECRLFC